MTLTWANDASEAEGRGGEQPSPPPRVSSFTYSFQKRLERSSLDFIFHPVICEYIGDGAKGIVISVACILEEKPLRKSPCFGPLQLFVNNKGKVAITEIDNFAFLCSGGEF